VIKSALENHACADACLIFFALCRASKLETEWFVSVKIVTFDPNCRSFLLLDSSTLRTPAGRRRRAQRQEEQQGREKNERARWTESVREAFVAIRLHASLLDRAVEHAV
jgi:hypothetical protein